MVHKASEPPERASHFPLGYKEPGLQAKQSWYDDRDAAGIGAFGLDGALYKDLQEVKENPVHTVMCIVIALLHL